MRQKIISLSLDTYELASKKANFSAWVRRKLLEEVPDARIFYGAYCSACDYHFTHPFDLKMKDYSCKFCEGETEFLGEVQ